MKALFLIAFGLLLSLTIYSQNIEIDFTIQSKKLLNDSIYKVEFQIVTHHSYFKRPKNKYIHRFNKNNIQFPTNYVGGDTLILSTLLYRSKVTVYFNDETPKKRKVTTGKQTITLYFHKGYITKGLYIMANRKSVYLKTN